MARALATSKPTSTSMSLTAAAASALDFDLCDLKRTSGHEQASATQQAWFHHGLKSQWSQHCALQNPFLNQQRICEWRIMLVESLLQLIVMRPTVEHFIKCVSYVGGIGTRYSPPRPSPICSVYQMLDDMKFLF